MTPIRVLYVGGTGRTGSTLLERVLGSMPGVVSLGEMTWFWYAMRAGGRCSCGLTYDRCPLWSAALDEAYGEVGIDPSEMYRLRMRHDSRHLPLLALPGASDRLMRRLGPYPERLVDLYRAVREVSGASVLVDSSKEPHYSHILASRPEFDVRVVHLVRHPVAVAWSWSRVRVEHGFGGAHTMETRGPLSASVYYNVSNVGTERLWGGTDRYRLLRYEDLVADPLAQLRSLCQFAGIDSDPAEIMEPPNAEGGATVVRLGELHSAWGNPNRFESGTLSIRPDEEWQARSAAIGPTVWRLTAPVARRYGYRYPMASGAASSVGRADAVSDRR